MELESWGAGEPGKKELKSWGAGELGREKIKDMENRAAFPFTRSPDNPITCSFACNIHAPPVA
jgi:hypothetical protein